MAENKMTREDYAKLLGVSVKEITEAWHQAHDDAQQAGELPEREQRKEEQAMLKFLRKVLAEK